MAEDRKNTTGRSSKDFDERSQLEAKLAAAEKLLKEKQEELDRLASAEAGMRVVPDNKAFKGDEGGYKFQVGPRYPDKFPHLKTTEVYAVDESEAKRWYCVAHQHPASSGRQVDPLRVPIDVKCLDERRNEVLRHKKRVAAIRGKINSGLTLSPDDKKTLEQYEKEILGYE